MGDYRNNSNAGQRKQMHYSPNLLNTINNAIDNCLLATIEYDSREKGITVRDVEPMGLVFRDGKRNLVGFCHLRNEYRSFRLDRLNMIKFGSKHFELRSGLDLAEFGDQGGSYQDEQVEED